MVVPADFADYEQAVKPLGTGCAVRVEGETVGEIGAGLLILLGVEQGDEGTGVDQSHRRCFRLSDSRTPRFASRAGVGE